MTSNGERAEVEAASTNGAAATDGQPGIDAQALKEAEAAKTEANARFKEAKYAQAVVGYTRAINLHPACAIYYANRAFAHIKLENYGSAIADATKAIELDSAYIKGYYRRGDAHFAMGKYKDALRDFRLAAKVSPRDPDLRKKLNECEKEVKRMRFEEALASPDTPVVSVSATLDLASMPVEDSYKGIRMDGDNESGYQITLDFVKSMMEEFREQRGIHKRFAFEIVMAAQSVLRATPTLVDVPIAADAHFTVCGDVHGQYYDLLNIFKLNGLPSESNPYLFNGDFVDRGSFSAEVILTLMALKVLYPNHMHLARGNHESKAMNKIYGFDGEVKHKYNMVLVDLFRETFCWLPLAHVLNGAVFVVHGGLFSKDGVTLDDIRAVDRNREPPDEGLMCEMLWSDPSPIEGRQASKRGVGVAFGPDVTDKFLRQNNLKLVVRSHEVKDEGFQVEHDGKLVTVFSAPNYCDSMGNKGAFIKFSGSDMVPHFTTFAAVPHPDVKPMQYAGSLMSLFGL